MGGAAGLGIYCAEDAEQIALGGNFLAGHDLGHGQGQIGEHMAAEQLFLQRACAALDRGAQCSVGYQHRIAPAEGGRNSAGGQQIVLTGQAFPVVPNGAAAAVGISQGAEGEGEEHASVGGIVGGEAILGNAAGQAGAVSVGQVFIGVFPGGGVGKGMGVFFETVKGFVFLAAQAHQHDQGFDSGQGAIQGIAAFRAAEQVQGR